MTRLLQRSAPAMLAIAIAVSLSTVPVAVVVSAVPGAPGNTRTHIESHAGGTELVERAGEAAPVEVVTPHDPGALRDLQVVWQRTLTDAIYTTCAILEPSLNVAAGTYLNPPREAELIALGGDGTPAWVYPGDEVHVSASRDGDVMAGVDYVSATQTVTVHRWAPGSSTPLWSDTITGVSRGSYRTIAVSADGSTIAVLVSVQAGGPFARLYLYDPGSSTPTGVYDGPAGFARNLSIGADGRFVAFIGLSTAYVVDRDAAAMRWSGSMGATNDPIAISTDGSYLAFGWQSLQMRQWNGVDYASHWSVAGSGYQLKSVTFSSDGSTFAAGWYRNDFHQNRIQLFAPALSAPLWTHLDLVGSGSYQDVPYDLALTAGGEYLVVGGFGDIVNTNDEVQLFERSSPVPVASVDTPGSMFDVDVALNEGSEVLITACGKHVHANQTGRGGDLFSVTYTAPVAVGESSSRPAGLELAVASPFAAGGSVVLSAGRAADVELAIYSMMGRRIRVLGSGGVPVGRHAVCWDGRDDRGRPVAPGVYIVQGRSRLGNVSARTVLVR